MPIFMDRHEMPALSAEEVASAHQRDLDLQDQYGVSVMAYWFDSRRHTAFCLIDAPDAATADRLHRESHGNVANAIIPVELATVEAFLGRVCDPPAPFDSAGPASGAGLRAVMFTDIVGSTEMTARLGDAAAHELVSVHDAIVRRALKRFGGREVKHTGDGLMASFEVVERAVRAAAEIQHALAEFSRRASEAISVRIGIAAGEPVEHGRDLFGATVQLASRLCAEAEPGGVVVSDTVCELCESSALRFLDLGRRQLRGFPQPTAVFRLDREARNAGAELVA